MPARVLTSFSGTCKGAAASEAGRGLLCLLVRLREMWCTDAITMYGNRRYCSTIMQRLGHARHDRFCLARFSLDESDDGDRRPTSHARVKGRGGGVLLAVRR